MTRRQRFNEKTQRIVDCAEKHFGSRVVSVSTPGGEGRSSCRLHFEDRTVIATLRPNFRRAHLEAFVLQRLEPFCDDIPRSLGIVGEIIFQSDVGSRRLNQDIVKHGAQGKHDLAAEAVAAIFRIQSAARKAGLESSLPHLGVNAAWIDNFTSASDALHDFSGSDRRSVDVDTLRRRISVPATQFVKWDCRSGNAAIGEDDRLRWFDFEYSGVRHGAEDLAWLIGDEAWPLAPQTMEEIVRDGFDTTAGRDLDAYLDYLSLYVTLHCVQRFKLIVKEAKKRGWLSKTRVRKFDDAGVHPEFAAHLCRVGAYFAARSDDTAPIGRDFEAAGRVFKSIILNAA